MPRSDENGLRRWVGYELTAIARRIAHRRTDRRTGPRTTGLKTHSAYKRSRRMLITGRHAADRVLLGELSGIVSKECRQKVCKLHTFSPVHTGLPAEDRRSQSTRSTTDSWRRNASNSCSSIYLFEYGLSATFETPLERDPSRPLIALLAIFLIPSIWRFKKETSKPPLCRVNRL